MTRWAPWFLVVLALCGLVWGSRSSSPELLEDTDTVALLKGLEAHGDALYWFTHDWPLENHFYRPVSTLAFWADYSASLSDGGAGRAVQFGRTNALIACLCVLLCFWVWRELTDSPWQTLLATALFAVWHLGEATVQWIEVSVAWLGVLCLAGLARGGVQKLWPCLFGLLGCLFLSSQLTPVEDFSWRIVGWLPGRTASVMTVFALIAVASYARYVRTTGVRMLREATAEDVPATKSARQVTSGRLPVLWLVLSGVSLLLALGSYEQAVMVPALVFGVWMLYGLRGVKSAWWPHLLFWGLLLVYLVFRSQIVPSEVSGYQAQQFRSGPGVWVSLGDYLVPGVYVLYMNLVGLGASAFIMLNGSFWSPVLAAFGNFTTYFSARKDWSFLGYLLLGFVAFLPMAWLQPFGHYHYLPSVFRAGFVVALAVVVARLVVSAASLPELQAPPRRGPAPGSLLRP